MSDSEQAAAPDLAKLRKSFDGIRTMLRANVIAGAKGAGWSEADAKDIAAQAELIFFDELSNGAAPWDATEKAVGLAQRAHMALLVMTAEARGTTPEAQLDALIAQQLDTGDAAQAKKAETARTVFAEARGSGAPLENAFYRALDAALAA